MNVSVVLHASAVFPEEGSSGIHWIEDWVGPTVGLNNMEKRIICPLPEIEPRLSMEQPSAIPTEQTLLKNGNNEMQSSECFLY
jgi:hypothetical protein